MHTRVTTCRKQHPHMLPSTVQTLHNLGLTAKSQGDIAACFWLLNLTPTFVSCQNFHLYGMNFSEQSIEIQAKNAQLLYVKAIYYSLVKISSTAIAHGHQSNKAQWLDIQTIPQYFMHTNLCELAGQYDGKSAQTWANPQLIHCADPGIKWKINKTILLNHPVWSPQWSR